MTVPLQYLGNDCTVNIENVRTVNVEDDNNVEGSPGKLEAL